MMFEIEQGAVVIQTPGRRSKAPPHLFGVRGDMGPRMGGCDLSILPQYLVFQLDRSSKAQPRYGVLFSPMHCLGAHD